MYALYYKTFLSDDSAELPDLGPLAGYSPLRRDENKPQGLVAPEQRRASNPEQVFAVTSPPVENSKPTDDAL